VAENITSALLKFINQLPHEYEPPIGPASVIERKEPGAHRVVRPLLQAASRLLAGQSETRPCGSAARQAPRASNRALQAKPACCLWHTTLRPCCQPVSACPIQRSCADLHQAGWANQPRTCAVSRKVTTTRRPIAWGFSLSSMFCMSRCKPGRRSTSDPCSSSIAGAHTASLRMAADNRHQHDPWSIRSAGHCCACCFD